MNKRCSNCFASKPVTEFYRKLDKYQARCKQCNAEVCAAYKFRNQPAKLERFFDRRERKQA